MLNWVLLILMVAWIDFKDFKTNIMFLLTEKFQICKYTYQVAQLHLCEYRIDIILLWELGVP